MEAVTHRVGEITTADREALEHLVGRALRADQEVVIRVVENAAPHKAQSSTMADDVPDWWKIYDGLSEEEIERLDQAIRQRRDLTSTC